MPVDEKVAKLLPRFETVLWKYDGLNGKIIPWTKEHGGKSDDPSIQAFVAGVDGKVFARSPDTTTYNAPGFAKWLAEQSKAYERAHPRTRMPFVRAEVTDEAGCAALDSAREAGARLLLYFGREEAEGAGKAERKESSAARKFEEKTLDSKSAAEAAKGWTLLRFDLSDPRHAKLAKTFGVTTAPRLVLVVPGAEGPEDLGPRVSGSSLAYKLKKHAKAQDD